MVVGIDLLTFLFIKVKFQVLNFAVPHFLFFCVLRSKSHGMSKNYATAKPTFLCCFCLHQLIVTYRYYEAKARFELLQVIFVCNQLP